MQSLSKSSPIFKVSDLKPAVVGSYFATGVSLTLHQGETIGIIGPSGCGKTMLLRSIVGLSIPLAGSVTLDNKTPDELGWPQFRKDVLYVQQRAPIFECTTRQLTKRSLQYQSVNGSECSRTEINEYFSKVRLNAEILDQPLRDLSEGERQRVAIIRALLLKPRIMLLDEPTSSLDTNASIMVESLLTQCKVDFGTAFMIVTHSESQAKRFCDRTIDITQFMTDNTLSKGSCT